MGGFFQFYHLVPVPDPDPSDVVTKNSKISVEKKCSNFMIKKCNIFVLKPPAPLREHPALQITKFLNFFSFLWFTFVFLDPDPDPHSQCRSGSRSSRPKSMRIHAGLELQLVGPYYTSNSIDCIKY
jgi:hypothetical protein